jgi:hypothetical protein
MVIVNILPASASPLRPPGPADADSVPAALVAASHARRKPGPRPVVLAPKDLWRFLQLERDKLPNLRLPVVSLPLAKQAASDSVRTATARNAPVAAPPATSATLGAPRPTYNSCHRSSERRVRAAARHMQPLKFITTKTCCGHSCLHALPGLTLSLCCQPPYMGRPPSRGSRLRCARSPSHGRAPLWGRRRRAACHYNPRTA